MKSLIVYYSQTGNTRKVARAVHRGLSTVSESCEILTVKEVDPASLADYDLIGLGTPVWNGGEPPNVRLFLNSLPEQEGRHLFSFNTHGVMPELYFPSMVRRLKAKGFTVIGTKDWYGDCIIQTFPSPYFTGGHPDEIDLGEAEEFGRAMGETSRRISQCETDLIPPRARPRAHAAAARAGGVLPAGTQRPRPAHLRPGEVQLPQVPPLRGQLLEYIDFSASPRRYGSEGDACNMWMGCTFCENICPTGAISGDWEGHSQRMKHVFAGLGMGGENLLERVIGEAEAAGRFSPDPPVQTANIG